MERGREERAIELVLEVRRAERVCLGKVFGERTSYSPEGGEVEKAGELDSGGVADGRAGRFQPRLNRK